MARNSRSLIGTPLEQASRWMFTNIIASLARTLHGEELSVAQLAALHVIDRDGDVRQAQLAGEIGLSPSATSRLVDALVQRGLVERREAPEDRRARTLRLTGAGTAMLDEISEARTRLFTRITSKLPRSLFRVFLANVARVRAAGIPPESAQPGDD